MVIQGNLPQAEIERLKSAETSIIEHFVIVIYVYETNKLNFTIELSEIDKKRMLNDTKSYFRPFDLNQSFYLKISDK
jgi:hypothetical protein